jgi:hypothetical protein
MSCTASVIFISRHVTNLSTARFESSSRSARKWGSDRRALGLPAFLTSVLLLTANGVLTGWQW